MIAELRILARGAGGLMSLAAHTWLRGEPVIEEVTKATTIVTGTFLMGYAKARWNLDLHKMFPFDIPASKTPCVPT